MNPFNKLSARHRLPVVQAAAYELFIRLYRSKYMRGGLKRFFPRRQPAGWFFLVGCYNAGTTVVKNAIAAHPDVSTAPIEGDVLTSHLPHFETGGWPRAMLANAYLINQHRRTGGLDAAAIASDWRPWIREGKYFLEKSISLSVRMDLLRKSFPGCKFVCVSRDPDAVIRGILQRSKPRGSAVYLVGADQYPAAFLRRQWAYIYGLILEDAREDDTLFVSYEDFISAPDTAVTQLHAFLGLRPVAVGFSRDRLQVGDVALEIRPLAGKPGVIGDVKSYLVRQVNEIKGR